MNKSARLKGFGRRTTEIYLIMERSELFRREFYNLDENIGSESGCAEFISGPGIINDGFRGAIARYVCGFVNSRENGQLLLGVNDDGRVVGYVLENGQAVRIRRNIDEAIKELHPHLFPSDYSVRCVPVLSGGMPDGQRVVIEINVYGQSMTNNNELYYNKQGVYVHMDGGIRSLKPNGILEWLKRHHIEPCKNTTKRLEIEVENRDKQIQKLTCDLVAKDRQINTMENALLHQKTTEKALNDRISQLKNDMNYMRRQDERLRFERSSSKMTDRLQEIRNIIDDRLPPNKQPDPKSAACVIV